MFCGGLRKRIEELDLRLRESRAALTLCTFAEVEIAACFAHVGEMMGEGKSLLSCFEHIATSAERDALLLCRT